MAVLPAGLGADPLPQKNCSQGGCRQGRKAKPPGSILPRNPSKHREGVRSGGPPRDGACHLERTRNFHQTFQSIRVCRVSAAQGRRQEGQTHGPWAEVEDTQGGFTEKLGGWQPGSRARPKGRDLASGHREANKQHVLPLFALPLLTLNAPPQASWSPPETTV